MVMTLYHNPGSCALASLIALEEASAEYQAVRVDFTKGAQREPAYLAINPKGRVPALATERGVLTETPAILAFIAQQFRGAELAPLSDPFAFAQAQAFNSYLCATVHVAHAHGHRGYRWADDAAAIEAMKRKVPASMSECFAVIEREMLRGPWVMGEAYTICDGYLFTMSRWLEVDGVDVAELPRVMKHRARMAERASVQRALAVEGKGG